MRTGHGRLFAVLARADQATLHPCLPSPKQQQYHAASLTQVSEQCIVQTLGVRQLAGPLSTNVGASNEASSGS